MSNVVAPPRPWTTVDTAAVVAIFAGTLACYAPDWRYDLQWGGISTTGAERVLRGDVPYRDFWTIYAPAHFYLLAALFHVFGTHLLVEVIAASVVSAAAACLCYVLARHLAAQRLVALACAAILVAAMYNTGYFKRLSTYPSALLLLLVILSLIVHHYRSGRIGLLAAAGVVTGLLTIVKHDVGAYTVIAVVCGLLAEHIAARWMHQDARPWISSAAVYLGGLALIAVPVAVGFARLAGTDMLHDLIVFPLTDFRYARPERYPSLLPFEMLKGTPAEMAEGFLYYLAFAIPFALFLCGLGAIALAVRSRRPWAVAAGVTFAVAFLLHHSAAHVQINTHIVTMSVYASLLGVLFLDCIDTLPFSSRHRVINGSATVLVAAWFGALLAKPAIKSWEMRRSASAELSLPKVSGFKVRPDEAQTYADLAAFVGSHLRPDESLYVGLRRHDIIVFGDAIIYFILDRPYATRYHELHPGIADTAPVQREIIKELRDKNVSVIVLKDVLSDATLDRVKAKFSLHLPVGATDLDDFIRAHYAPVRTVGPYTIWVRAGTDAVQPPPERHQLATTTRPEPDGT